MKKPNSIEKLYRQTSQKQCGTQSTTLNPPPKPISIKPDTMNNYFVNIAKQAVKKDPVSLKDIEKLITQLLIKCLLTLIALNAESSILRRC